MNAIRTTLIYSLLGIASLHAAAVHTLDSIRRRVTEIGDTADTQTVDPLVAFPSNPAHQYLNLMYGKVPRFPIVPTIGTIAQACALTSQSEGLTTVLYTTALVTRAIDTLALIGAAVTPQPGKETTNFWSRKEGPWRVFYGFLGLMQLLRLPYHVRLIRESEKILRAARQPNLQRTLELVRDTRIKNSLLRVLIFWGVRATFWVIDRATPLPEGIAGAAGRTGIAIFISRFMDDLFLDTNAEQHGIEEKLMRQGERRPLTRRRSRRNSRDLSDVAAHVRPGPLAQNDDLTFEI